jgi:YD repeat-containing protein
VRAPRLPSPVGRLSQVIDGQGNVATYQYDALGNLLSIHAQYGWGRGANDHSLTPHTGSAGSSVNVSQTGPSLATSHTVAVFTSASLFFSATVTTGLTP